MRNLITLLVLLIPTIVNAGYMKSEQMFNRLEERRNINPERFDMNHPSLGNYLNLVANVKTDPETYKDVDLIPDTHLWNVAQYRYELNPDRFRHYHPLMGMVFDINKTLEFECNPPVVIPPTPVEPPVIPEPSSIILTLIGVVSYVAVSYFGRRSDSRGCGRMG